MADDTNQGTVAAPREMAGAQPRLSAVAPVAVSRLPRRRRRHLPAPLRLLLVALAGALVGALASYMLRKLGL